MGGDGLGTSRHRFPVPLYAPRMARSQIIAQLAEVPLFAACSKKELQFVARATTEVSFADGDVIVTQDETAREAFVIVEGTAVVRRNKRKVAEVGPGATIGELGLLDRGPRTATVVAAGPVSALVLTPQEFSGVLAEVPSIGTKLLKSMAAMVRDLDSKAYG